jgi:hypothetical protein
MNCIACGSNNSERHHIKTRKTFGSNEDFNILNLCRQHHSLVHTCGMNKFIEKFPQIKNVLIEKGWEFEEFRKKWFHHKHITSQDPKHQGSHNQQSHPLNPKDP